MENKVYSYHTFIFPFIWEGEATKRISMEKFVAIFENNPNWQDTNLNGENKFPNFDLRLDGTSELTFYKEYQYFHQYVRRAIYGTEPSLIRNFSFMPEKVNNKGRYYIEKSKYCNSTGRIATRKYMLMLNGIKLKIFNTGVALFIVECENHGVDADGRSQASIEDVKNINNYGRRISLPFIPTSFKTDSSCADKLTVEIPGVAVFEDDYGTFIQSILDKDEKTIPRNALSLTHISDWIKEILGYGGSYRFTSKNSGQPASVFIYPALDDRMFVACCVCEDKKIVNDWKAEKDGDYAFLTDDKQSMSLYEFAFVDPGMFAEETERNCTCVSKKMRTNLLKDHVYDRWLLLGEAEKGKTDYGTIYTIANQGLMMATNFCQDHIIESFLTQYIQMCCLVLTQRATLIHFQREAASLSSHIEEQGKSLDKKTITKLMNLQERFVAFQSQLSFNEVTPQEQGIEIYNLLRKFMFIDEETESLNARLDILENASATNLDFGFNKIALIFTYISCFLAVFQNIFCLYTGQGKFENWYSAPVLIISSITVLAIIITLTVVLVRYRRRKK